MDDALPGPTCHRRTHYREPHHQLPASYARHLLPDWQHLRPHRIWHLGNQLQFLLLHRPGHRVEDPGCLGLLSRLFIQVPRRRLGRVEVAIVEWPSAPRGCRYLQQPSRLSAWSQGRALDLRLSAKHTTQPGTKYPGVRTDCTAGTNVATEWVPRFVLCACKFDL